jgi:hypothetical protein
MAREGTLFAPASIASNSEEKKPQVLTPLVERYLGGEG